MDRVITQVTQLSTIIRSARKSLDIDQAHIADRLAITQGRYSQLESNISRLTIDRLLVILHDLGLECVIRKQQATPTEGMLPVSPENMENIYREDEGSAVSKAAKIQSIVKAPSLGFQGSVTHRDEQKTTTASPNEDIKSSGPDQAINDA